MEAFLGTGQVLEQLDFGIEPDHERLVLRFLDDLIEEQTAGGLFVVDNSALAQAGIHQQADGQRQVRLPRKIPDGLGIAVFLEAEILFVEIAHELAAAVANGGQKIDHLDAGLEDGVFRGERPAGKRGGGKPGGGERRDGKRGWRKSVATA
jgi:hypothetical protein